MKKKKKVLLTDVEIEYYRLRVIKQYDDFALKISRSKSKYGLNFQHELKLLQEMGASEKDICNSFFEAVENCHCFIFKGPNFKALFICWHALLYPERKAYTWLGRDYKMNSCTREGIKLVGQEKRWDVFVRLKGQIKKELYCLILEKIMAK